MVSASHLPGHVPGAVKSFTCPNCSGSIAIRAAGLSITAVCEHCGSVIDVANENFQLITKARQRTREVPLPLGSRGTLFDTEWEVIGFMERDVVNAAYAGAYSWREYLLFNPWQGFRFLVEADGHWSFVSGVRRSLKPFGNTAFYDRQSFRLYNTCNAAVTYVMGEFYWRVKVGDHAYLADYIAPPAMLSLEQTRDEINWSSGVYVEGADVQKAFAITSDFPRPIGVGAIQPNKYAQGLRRHSKLFLVILILLILGQCTITAGARDELLVQQQFSITAPELGKPVVLGPFTLSEGKANVELRVTAPVNNNWFELDADLVNTQTQDAYSFTTTVEYYYGYDSDGYWSEGSQSQSSILSSVPGGTYQLVITPNSGIIGANAYSIALKRDVPVWSNFFLAFLLVVAFPVFQLLRRSAFEKARWEESDTTARPYFPAEPASAPGEEPTATRRSILDDDNPHLPWSGQ